MIYLDNAATTMPKPASVERAVRQAMMSMASPGRGAHAPAMRAAETLFQCRTAAAELFNVSEPERVVFTMNATHALNIAIRSKARRGTKVVISGFEHNSVTRPLNDIGANVTIAGRKLFDSENTLNEFRREIPRAELVVCTHVSNVFGYILPVYEIAELCRKHRVPLIVDASQSAGILDVDFQRLGAAFIAMPGHKSLFGPQGTGILLCGESGIPLMQGGSGSDSIPQSMPEYLPDRLEAGTHNTMGIAGLLEGIKFVQEKGTETIRKHERALLELMVRELDGEKTEIFTAGPSLQSGVLSLRLRGASCEELADGLSQRGVCVRSGLHCAPTAHQSAGTLDTGTIRFSFSPFVSRDQVLSACDILRDISRRGAGNF